MIYITEFEFFRNPGTIHKLKMTDQFTGEAIDDGYEVIFVNTQIKDGTDISELMDCFLQKEVNNPKFANLSRRVRELKEEEGGIEAMCEVMERCEKKAREEGREEGIKKGREEGLKEGREKGLKEGIQTERMISLRILINLGTPKEEILKHYTEDDYNKAAILIKEEKARYGSE